jgi:hypothetical protein
MQCVDGGHCSPARHTTHIQTTKPAPANNTSAVGFFDRTFSRGLHSGRKVSDLGLGGSHYASVRSSSSRSYSDLLDPDGIDYRGGPPSTTPSPTCRVLDSWTSLPRGAHLGPGGWTVEDKVRNLSGDSRSRTTWLDNGLPGYDV